MNQILSWIRTGQLVTVVFHFCGRNYTKVFSSEHSDEEIRTRILGHELAKREKSPKIHPQEPTKNSGSASNSGNELTKKQMLAELEKIGMKGLQAQNAATVREFYDQAIKDGKIHQ